MTYRYKLAEATKSKGVRKQIFDNKSVAGILGCPETYFNISEEFNFPCNYRNESNEDDYVQECIDCWNQKYCGESLKEIIDN